jgi:hypothetical protein
LSPQITSVDIVSIIDFVLKTLGIHPGTISYTITLTMSNQMRCLILKDTENYDYDIALTEYSANGSALTFIDQYQTLCSFLVKDVKLNNLISTGSIDDIEQLTSDQLCVV